MDTLFQDLRQSLRLLVRSPGITSVAILTLALSLGANTAVFSVINGVLLQALPYPEPDRIVDASILLPASGDQPGGKPLPLENQKREVMAGSTSASNTWAA